MLKPNGRPAGTPEIMVRNLHGTKDRLADEEIYATSGWDECAEGGYRGVYTQCPIFGHGYCTYERRCLNIHRRGEDNWVRVYNELRPDDISQATVVLDCPLDRLRAMTQVGEALSKYIEKKMDEYGQAKIALCRERAACTRHGCTFLHLTATQLERLQRSGPTPASRDSTPPPPPPVTPPSSHRPSPKSLSLASASACPETHKSTVPAGFVLAGTASMSNSKAGCWQGDGTTSAPTPNAATPAGNSKKQSKSAAKSVSDAPASGKATTKLAAQPQTGHAQEVETGSVSDRSSLSSWHERQSGGESSPAEDTVYEEPPKRKPKQTAVRSTPVEPPSPPQPPLPPAVPPKADPPTKKPAADPRPPAAPPVAVPGIVAAAHGVTHQAAPTRVASGEGYRGVPVPATGPRPTKASRPTAPTAPIEGPRPQHSDAPVKPPPPPPPAEIPPTPAPTVPPPDRKWPVTVTYGTRKKRLVFREQDGWTEWFGPNSPLSAWLRDQCSGQWSATYSSEFDLNDASDFEAYQCDAATGFGNGATEYPPIAIAFVPKAPAPEPIRPPTPPPEPRPVAWRWGTALPQEDVDLPRSPLQQLVLLSDTREELWDLERIPHEAKLSDAVPVADVCHDELIGEAYLRGYISGLLRRIGEEFRSPMPPKHRVLVLANCDGDTDTPHAFVINLRIPWVQDWREPLLALFVPDPDVPGSTDFVLRWVAAPGWFRSHETARLLLATVFGDPAGVEITNGFPSILLVPPSFPRPQFQFGYELICNPDHPIVWEKDVAVQQLGPTQQKALEQCVQRALQRCLLDPSLVGLHWSTGAEWGSRVEFLVPIAVGEDFTPDAAISLAATLALDGSSLKINSIRPVDFFRVGARLLGSLRERWLRIGDAKDG